ncbi:cationic peroxidase 1-like [Nymphaea colorata]|nr:cationic peroxidase 1-like [Nymphaea colorata]
MASPLPRCMALVVLVAVAAAATSASAQLSTTFYDTICPTALSTIKAAVVSAVQTEARMGASLLRLHFHDCFVQGCDASVLLDDTATFTGEKTAAPNMGSLRGFEVIDAIKSAVDKACGASVVSCADILSVAARDSVVALGGPSWNVPLGRRDSTTASLSSANTDLPSPFSSLATLIAAFQAKGFNQQELVALSGAHSIGQARCVLFRDRIYNDTNIAPLFATTRQSQCPRSGGDNNLAPLDASTPYRFDNAYYLNLLVKRGLLHSDQELFNGGSADAQVRTYSLSPSIFSTDFAAAMVKMASLSPLTGSNGQVRTNCRKVN